MGGVVRTSADEAERRTGARARALPRRQDGTGTIIREGDRWRARLPGRLRQTVAVAPSYDEAERRLDAALALVGASADRPDASISLWHWTERVIDQREAERLRNTKSERWQLARHVGRDEIGRVPLGLLHGDAAACRAWVGRMMLRGGRGGRPLSSRTVHNMVALMRDVLRRAVDAGIIASSPMADVRVPRAARRVEQGEPWTVLEPEEQRRLLAVRADGDGRGVVPEQLEAMVRVALGIGLRKQELLQLRWGDLVLGGSRPHAVIRYGSRGGGPTKGGKPRRVPLFGMALEALRLWSRAQNEISVN